MQARKIALFCATAAVALTLTVSSFAQNPARQGQGQRRGQGRNRAASVATLPVSVIDSIVKLTPEQKTKVTTIHDKFIADTRALRPQQGGQPDPANAQKLRDLNRQAVADVEAVLTQEQKDKFKAAAKDLQLYRSVGIPMELYGQVKLTDEQKTKLATIEKETTEKSQGVTDRAQVRQINQDARAKAEAILTADQKAAVEKYRKEHPREGRRPRP
jgi:hypothetical protein